MLFQGEGGATKTVQGIDFWIIGRPSRVNRELGVVHVTVGVVNSRHPAQLNDRDFFNVVEARVGEVAKNAGGNAAILTAIGKNADGTTYFYYRVVAYLPEGAPVGGPIRRDPTVIDADGKSVPNGMETPIRTLQFPDISGAPWSQRNMSALVEVCVGIDGAITGVSTVTSSGNAADDALVIHQVRNAKYSPATVRGRPVASCKDIKVTWHAL